MTPAEREVVALRELAALRVALAEDEERRGRSLCVITECSRPRVAGRVKCAAHLTTGGCAP